MIPDLSGLTTQLGYGFNNADLLRQALSHRSAGGYHNERLEFLGDSLVNTWVAATLYQAYPNATEGELSAMRAALVCKASLASIGRSLHLGEYLLLGEGTRKSGGRQLDSILADTYEAILGAIYLDSNWDTLGSTIERQFSGRIESVENVESIRDAKSRLQEWLQAKKIPVPVYELMDVGGPGHAQTFRVNCVFDGAAKSYVGKGSSRRKAEQQAAQAALSELMEDHEG